jgi:hypothetical protein
LTETFCVFVKITESILKHFTLKFSWGCRKQLWTMCGYLDY